MSSVQKIFWQNQRQGPLMTYKGCQLASKIRICGFHFEVLKKVRRWDTVDIVYETVIAQQEWRTVKECNISFLLLFGISYNVSHRSLDLDFIPTGRVCCTPATPHATHEVVVNSHHLLNKSTVFIGTLFSMLVYWINIPPQNSKVRLSPARGRCIPYLSVVVCDVHGVFSVWSTHESHAKFGFCKQRKYYFCYCNITQVHAQHNPQWRWF